MTQCKECTHMSLIHKLFCIIKLPKTRKFTCDSKVNHTVNIQRAAWLGFMKSFILYLCTIFYLITLTVDKEIR